MGTIVLRYNMRTGIEHWCSEPEPQLGLLGRRGMMKAWDRTRGLGTGRRTRPPNSILTHHNSMPAPRISIFTTSNSIAKLQASVLRRLAGPCCAEVRSSPQRSALLAGPGGTRFPPKRTTMSTEIHQSDWRFQKIFALMRGAPVGPRRPALRSRTGSLLQKSPSKTSAAGGSQVDGAQ